MDYICRVTEKNVDGCGGDATEFVRFSQPLDRMAAALFARILQEAKGNAGEDDGTEDMISDALSRFGDESGIYGSIANVPYEGSFEF